MKREQFKMLPNFSYQELINHYKSKGFDQFRAGIEISKIKYSALKKVQKLRTLIGRPIFFNSITEGKHVKNSAHYSGIAFDIRIGGKGAINWNKMFQYAVDAGFKGIGYYPFWNIPGFHVDDRPCGFKCWKRLKNGKYVGFL